jgi:hypothetical protein
MMKGQQSSEMSVIIYQITWCNMKEGLNPEDAITLQKMLAVRRLEPR